MPPGSNIELDATFGVAIESDLLVKYAAAASQSDYDLSPADPMSLAPEIGDSNRPGGSVLYPAPRKRLGG